MEPRHFLSDICFWFYIDLQNPDKDIALVKGVPGAVLGLVGAVLMLDARALPFEFWRLYRSRDHKLPPFGVASWWRTTKVAGRGSLAAVVCLCTFFAFGEPTYVRIYLGISSFVDKAATIEALAMGDTAILNVVRSGSTQ